MSSRGHRGRGSKRRWGGDTGFEAWGGYMKAKVAKLEGQFEEQVGDGQEKKGEARVQQSGQGILISSKTGPCI